MLKTARKVISVFVLMFAISLFTQAQSGVNPSDPQGWTFTTFGTAPTVSTDANGWFVEIVVSNSKSILNPPIIDVPLGSVLPFQYEVEKIAGPGTTTWYVNFYVDLDGNGTCDKRFDFAPNQAVGTTSAFNASGAGWIQRSTCFGPNVSEGAVNIATIAAANPAAILKAVAFNMGDTAANYVGWSGYLRSVTIAGTTSVFGPAVAGGTGTTTVRPRFMFRDGRINYYDTATPIAAYGLNVDDELGLIVYEIANNSTGVWVLLVTPEQIASVPELPDENTLIAETETDNLVIYFWRLSSGEFQINVIQPNGKMYVLIFNALVSGGAGYTSFEYEMR